MTSKNGDNFYICDIGYLERTNDSGLGSDKITSGPIQIPLWPFQYAFDPEFQTRGCPPMGYEHLYGWSSEFPELQLLDLMKNSPARLYSTLAWGVEYLNPRRTNRPWCLSAHIPWEGVHIPLWGSSGLQLWSKIFRYGYGLNLLAKLIQKMYTCIQTSAKSYNRIDVLLMSQCSAHF